MLEPLVARIIEQVWDERTPVRQVRKTRDPSKLAKRVVHTPADILWSVMDFPETRGAANLRCIGLPPNSLRIPWVAPMDEQLADEQMRRSARPANILKIAIIALLVFLSEPVTADDTPRIYSFGGLDLLGQSPHYVELGIGVFDVFKRKSTSRRSATGVLS